MNHGVYTRKQATSVATPAAVEVGVPFVIGLAPLHKADADTRASALTPVLATSYAEAVAQLGYDDDWADYTLCEVMHYHFKFAQCQPVIFLPLTETVNSASFSGDGSQKTFVVTAKPARIYDVKVGGTAVEVTSYAPATGTVTLKNAPASGTDNVVVSYVSTPAASDVVSAVESIDLCMPMFSIIPDLILAPGFSDQSAVAAAMAAKATAINGKFQAKALVDIDAATYVAAITAKNNGTFTDAEIVCWPCGKLGDYIFHGSTLEAGCIARTDSDNGGVPYASPSNHVVYIDSTCLADGTAVLLDETKANILNGAGICTFYNNGSQFIAWSNVTGTWPGSSDVTDYFIPVSRMFEYVQKTIILTFRDKVDNPMNKRLYNTVVDSVNLWLNGLVGAGYLIGARCVYLDAENPVTSLMSGIITFHVYMTPPSPAQDIEFLVEYDVAYMENAFGA